MIRQQFLKQRAERFEKIILQHVSQEFGDGDRNLAKECDT
jgi:hypothetical protein